MVSSYSARWINTGVPISVLSFADCVRVPWASFSTRSSPSATSAPRTPRRYSARAAPVSQSLVIPMLGPVTWMPEDVSGSVCSRRLSVLLTYFSLFLVRISCLAPPVTSLGLPLDVAFLYPSAFPYSGGEFRF